MNVFTSTVHGCYDLLILYVLSHWDCIRVPQTKIALVKCSQVKSTFRGHHSLQKWIDIHLKLTILHENPAKFPYHFHEFINFWVKLSILAEFLFISNFNGFYGDNFTLIYYSVGNELHKLTNRCVTTNRCFKCKSIAICGAAHGIPYALVFKYTLTVLLFRILANHLIVPLAFDSFF